MRRLFFASLCVMLMSVSASAETMRFAADIWRPFFYLDENKQPKGISVELLREAMDRLGYGIEFSYLPNRRLREMFAAGEFDGVLLDAPEWVSPHESENSIFSTPLMQVREHVYMSEREERSFRSVDDFRGLNLGMAAGYQYPAFEPLFLNNEINKFELENVKSLALILQRGRIDGFFMDDFLYNYLLAEKFMPAEQFKPVFPVSEIDLSFRFHSKMASKLDAINAVLTEMKREGTVERVIARYVGADFRD